jgi:DNA-binding response OmpR family regulator
VLVVDDDPNVAEVVTRYLEREGFGVEVARDGHAALDRALAVPPDLVVLDLMLPGIDGLEVCRRLRALAPVPVVMLTAKGAEADRVVGLELGADDYLAKPFSPRELTARVKAVLRRAQGPLAAPASGPQRLVDGDLTVDVAARQARLGGEVVALTSRELELLVYFMRHPRQAFRRDELLRGVWGYTVGDTSTVTVHVRRLREKVEPDPGSPQRIATVWGVGYRWEGVA